MIVTITQVPTPPAPSFQGDITATGTLQATAAPLTARVNVVTVAPAGSGVLLTSAVTEQKVLNRGTAALAVYPPPGQAIEVAALNAPAAVAVGGAATFDFDGVDTWWVS